MPIYKLNLSKKALNFSRNLQAKQFKQIYTAIVDLLETPEPQDARKLKGYPDLLRRDVGEYRIIYRYDTEIVYIILVDKRNDDEIYKQLKRLL